METQTILSENNLIWIDLEMTGLDTDKDYIIEIATVVTDSQLNILADGPNIAIFQPHEVLLAMDEWNTRHHNQSGLVQRVLDSTYSAADAEQMTLEFLARWVPSQASPMCGSGICQDRRFLHRLMPKLEHYFFYRNFDVSAIKEMVRRWYPERQQFNSNPAHLAMDDIKESIEELKFYREHYFIR